MQFGKQHARLGRDGARLYALDFFAGCGGFFNWHELLDRAIELGQSCGAMAQQGGRRG